MKNYDLEYLEELNESYMMKEKGSIYIEKTREKYKDLFMDKYFDYNNPKESFEKMNDFINNNMNLEIELMEKEENNFEFKEHIQDLYDILCDSFHDSKKLDKLFNLEIYQNHWYDIFSCLDKPINLNDKDTINENNFIYKVIKNIIPEEIPSLKILKKFMDKHSHISLINSVLDGQRNVFDIASLNPIMKEDLFTFFIDNGARINYSERFLSQNLSSIKHFVSPLISLAEKPEDIKILLKCIGKTKSKINTLEKIFLSDKSNIQTSILEQILEKMVFSYNSGNNTIHNSLKDTYLLLQDKGFQLNSKNRAFNITQLLYRTHNLFDNIDFHFIIENIQKDLRPIPYFENERNDIGFICGYACHGKLFSILNREKKAENKSFYEGLRSGVIDHLLGKNSKKPLPTALEQNIFNNFYKKNNAFDEIAHLYIETYTNKLTIDKRSQKIFKEKIILQGYNTLTAEMAFNEEVNSVPSALIKRKRF